MMCILDFIEVKCSDGTGPCQTVCTMKIHSKTGKKINQITIIIRAVLQWTTMGNGLLIAVMHKGNLSALMVRFVIVLLSFHFTVTIHSLQHYLHLILDTIVLQFHKLIFISFYCHLSVTATKTYILIEQNKSWKEAQEFCRTFHTDLVNVRTSSENQEVKKTAKKDVWIGLFKDPWSWSDQSNSSFRFWNSSQLSNNRRDRDCVTVMVNQTGKWNDVQCNTTQPFICHGGAFLIFSSLSIKLLRNETE